MPRNKYTEQDKDDMVRRVDNRRKQGLSLPDACKKESVHLSMYNYWKAHRAGKEYIKPKNKRDAEISLNIQTPPSYTSSNPASSVRNRTPEDKKELARRTITLLERMWEVVDE